VSGDPSDRERREANRANWDERVPIHLGSEYYGVPAFRAGAPAVRPFVAEAVGPVAGLDLVHLQCHFGLETLDWARRGARVTGLDFSRPAVDAATTLATELGLPARFVHGDVYDASALLGRRFDIVYTGIGALNWLPDMAAWAVVVGALLRPSGALHLVEFHPLADILGDDDLSVAFDYLGGAPIAWDEPGTYADPGAATHHNRSFEWIHPLGEVVSELIAAGLRIEALREYDHTVNPRWPFLERGEDGLWHMPPGMPRPPLMYALRARAPAAQGE
jgi:SAM-dependent methyltransferase